MSDPLPKKREPKGTPFWMPISFADAKRLVECARHQTPPLGTALSLVVPQAIRVMRQTTSLGGLSCPSPPDDPDGVYRVGLDAEGLPEIQRRDARRVWQPVG